MDILERFGKQILFVYYLAAYFLLQYLYLWIFEKIIFWAIDSAENKSYLMVCFYFILVIIVVKMMINVIYYIVGDMIIKHEYRKVLATIIIIHVLVNNIGGVFAVFNMFEIKFNKTGIVPVATIIYLLYNANIVGGALIKAFTVVKKLREKQIASF